MSSQPFDEWDHWSASQIETFDLCNRKWWYNKRLKLPAPGTKSTNLGTLCHSEAEKYLETGDESVLGVIMRPGLENLRELRARNPQIEVPIGKNKRKGLGNGKPLITLAGLPGEGYIDVALPLEIWDHKTAGNLRYAKGEAELKTNHQGIIYARAAQVLADDFTSPVRFGHLVYLTVPPHTHRRTFVDLTPEHIDNRIAVLEKIVTEMKVVADVRSEISVTPTWSACSAYGGCPFKDRCHATRNINRLTQPQGTHMTLAEKLAASRGITQVPAQPAPPATNGTVSALQAKLAAARGQPVTGVVPPDAPLHDLPTEAEKAAAGPTEEALASATQGGADAARANKPRTSPFKADNPLSAAWLAGWDSAGPVTSPAETTTRTRKPRGGRDKAIALGWTGEQYDAMTVESAGRVVDEQLAFRGTGTGWDVTGLGFLEEVMVEEKEDTAEPIDINSIEALNAGMTLGWDEEALTNVMSPKKKTLDTA